MSIENLKSIINAKAKEKNLKVGLYFNDFSGNKLEINSSEIWESASCIKVPILIELFKRIESGEFDKYQLIEKTDEVYCEGSGILRSLSKNSKYRIYDVATLMIIVSDNVATNMLIDLLGIENINKTSKELGLENMKLFGKLKLFGDEENPIGTITPRDYGRIFEIIYNNELGSKNISNEIIDILKKQHYTMMLDRKFPQTFLSSKENKVEIATKSGSLNNCRNDGGIIFTPWKDYILTLLIKDFNRPNYYHVDHEAYELAPEISNMIFNQVYTNNYKD